MLIPVTSNLSIKICFDSFFTMIYYIISTTYQKIGDLFCPVIFLDFCTVCNMGMGKYEMIIRLKIVALDDVLESFLAFCQSYTEVL